MSKPRGGAQGTTQREMLQAARWGDCQQLQASLPAQPDQRHLGQLLLVAAHWGRGPAVRLLLWRAGADPAHADASGATALHLAARRGHQDVAELLLLTLPPPREGDWRSRRRLLDARDADGATPLADSCQHGHRQLADQLLQAGADPNLGCARSGRRPLHWAACQGDWELARLLLRAGADPAAVDCRGRTAATEADSLGHWELAHELRDAQRRYRPFTRPEADVISTSPPEQPVPPLSPQPQPQQAPQFHAFTQHRSQPQQSQPQQFTQNQSQPQQYQPQQFTQNQSQPQQFTRHQSQPQPLTRFQPQPQPPRVPSISNPPPPPPSAAARDLSQSQPTSGFGPGGFAQLRRFSDATAATSQMTTTGSAESAGATNPPSSRWQANDGGPLGLGSFELGPVAAPRGYWVTTRRPRGLCLVVNNQRHQPGPVALSDRPGSQYDVQRIRRLFGDRLGFDFWLEADLTGRRLREVAAHVASRQTEHELADAFVCFLLAHGSERGIYGTDGDPVPLADLAAAFDVPRCPWLAGKPKIFLVQACRGPAEVTACVSADGPTCGGVGIGARPLPLPSPEGVDFLYGFACCEERVAYRFKDSGSVYVQTLCDEIEQQLDSGGAAGHANLLNALQDATRRVSSAAFKSDSGQPVYMVPEVRTTLRFPVLLG